MRVLVSGGLGYIGSHIVVELCVAGFDVICVDYTTNTAVKLGIGKILDDHRKKKGSAHIGEVEFLTCDLTRDSICDLTKNQCDVIIHLAALKSVAESVENPLLYFDVNLKCLLSILQCARTWGNKPSFIFSSSATVYGNPNHLPITESHMLSAINPYGQSKIMCEQILKSVTQSNNSPVNHVHILRFFNPIGAHPSGHIGENPNGPPANLMPILCEVLAGQRTHVNIFGRDWATHDGTAVRDYLHVMDLAEAHVECVRRCVKLGYQQQQSEYLELNLGRGKGVSVLEMIREMECATGMHIKTHDALQRPGDVAECYSSADKAYAILGWVAKRSLFDMCCDSWNYYKKMLSE